MKSQIKEMLSRGKKILKFCYHWHSRVYNLKCLNIDKIQQTAHNLSWKHTSPVKGPLTFHTDEQEYVACTSCVKTLRLS